MVWGWGFRIWFGVEGLEFYFWMSIRGPNLWRLARFSPPLQKHVTVTHFNSLQLNLSHHNTLQTSADAHLYIWTYSHFTSFSDLEQILKNSRKSSESSISLDGVSNKKPLWQWEEVAEVTGQLRFSVAIKQILLNLTLPSTAPHEFCSDFCMHYQFVLSRVFNLKGGRASQVEALPWIGSRERLDLRGRAGCSGSAYIKSSSPATQRR